MAVWAHFLYLVDVLWAGIASPTTPAEDFWKPTPSFLTASGRAVRAYLIGGFTQKSKDEAR